MSAPANPPAWADVVAPIIQKPAVPAVTQQAVTMNPEACQAIARFLHQMAAKLDAHGIPVEDA